MKIKFWYVRHGETLFNRKGRLQGTCDSPLSQTGILEAEETAAALKNVYFDRIFVSPAGRARATAAYIAERRGIEPEVIDDLHEMDFGRLEGSRFASHPDEVRHCFDIRDFSSANGETLFEVEHRIDHAMRTIRQSCKDGDRVLIVSHGMLESLFMVHLFNFDFRKFDDERHAEGRSGIPNGGIMTFEFDENQYKLLSTPVEPTAYKPEKEKKTVHIYFVRHGECRFNLFHRMQGGCDSRLTETGVHQAEIAGDALRDIDFARMYYSPLGRAEKTAEILAQYHPDMTWKAMDDLKEVFVGDFEGVVVNNWHDEIEERHISRGWKDVGGESIEEVKVRVLRAFDTIVKEAKDNENILVVSHRNVYVNVMRDLFNIARPDLFEMARKAGKQATPNGGICRIDYVEGKYTLVDFMKTPEDYWNSLRTKK